MTSTWTAGTKDPVQALVDSAMGIGPDIAIANLRGDEEVYATGVIQFRRDVNSGTYPEN